MAKRGKKKYIIPPDIGWQPNTYYLVDVSYNSGNPVHQAIFFTGFLNGNDGDPGGYNRLFSGNYDEDTTISDVYYMRAIEVLHRKGDEPRELRMPNELINSKDIEKVKLERKIQSAIQEYINAILR